MRFSKAKEEAKKRGWELYKCGDTDAPNRYRHYKTGYIVVDGEHSHRWQTLGDFVLNCIEGNRWIDGFMRRS
ncbi:MAG: hypothetical protein MK111_18345 [Crocosphaera sp.]|uniref:hypothetical protein n=1 Tax=Crocosphaera sp. TaxID=2729996 RepID=UPI00258AF6D4|nr:hypothetical protein [Crocosphaera sp.]MCH2246561.1 hypothetical protein [Crocosphaera sp.]